MRMVATDGSSTLVLDDAGGTVNVRSIEKRNLLIALCNNSFKALVNKCSFYVIQV